MGQDEPGGEPVHEVVLDGREEELVADPAHGPDDARVAGVVTEGAPDAAHVHVDDPLVAVEVVAPDLLEQLGPREDPPGRGGQGPQQVELEGRQAHLGPVDDELATALVEGQAVEPQHVVVDGVAAPRAVGPAQHRPHPGHDLAGENGFVT